MYSLFACTGVVHVRGTAASFWQGFVVVVAPAPFRCIAHQTHGKHERTECFGWKTHIVSLGTGRVAESTEESKAFATPGDRSNAPPRYGDFVEIDLNVCGRDIKDSYTEE